MIPSPTSASTSSKLLPRVTRIAVLSMAVVRSGVSAVGGPGLQDAVGAELPGAFHHLAQVAAVSDRFLAHGG
jgi:hypothetical protein